MPTRGRNEDSCVSVGSLVTMVTICVLSVSRAAQRYISIGFNKSAKDKKEPQLAMCAVAMLVKAEPRPGAKRPEAK